MFGWLSPASACASRAKRRLGLSESKAGAEELQDDEPVGGRVGVAGQVEIPIPPPPRRPLISDRSILVGTSGMGQNQADLAERGRGRRVAASGRLRPVEPEGAAHRHRRRPAVAGRLAVGEVESGANDGRAGRDVLLEHRHGAVFAHALDDGG